MDYWGIGGACSLQVLPSFSVGSGGLEVAFLYSLSKLFTWILHCNLGTWWQSSCREFLKFSPWILHFFFLVVWWWLFCRVSLNYSLGFCIGVLVVWWKLFCRVFSKIFLWIWHWTWCFLVMAFHIFFLEFALDLFLLFHFCMVFCPLLHFAMDFVCVVGGFFCRVFSYFFWIMQWNLRLVVAFFGTVHAQAGAKGTGLWLSCCVFWFEPQWDMSFVQSPKLSWLYATSLCFQVATWISAWTLDWSSAVGEWCTSGSSPGKAIILAVRQVTDWAKMNLFSLHFFCFFFFLCLASMFVFF